MKEQIIELSVKDIIDFPRHSLKVNNDSNNEEFKESIMGNGILVPTIVRQKKDGKYEMLS